MKGLASVKAFHPFTYTYDISGYIRFLKNRAIRFNPKKVGDTAYLATSELSKRLRSNGSGDLSENEAGEGVSIAGYA